MVLRILGSRLGITGEGFHIDVMYRLTWDYIGLYRASIGISKSWPFSAQL